MYAYGFRFYFTPLTAVLFTFPSRYWFTIGRQRVFSLGGWSPHLHTPFHVWCVTCTQPDRISRTGVSPSMPCRSKHLHYRHWSLMVGLVRVRSPLLAESRLISFPPVTEMFHFTGYRVPFPISFRKGRWSSNSTRLPHSEISGSSVVCTYPKLIAAYHVLHRLLAPRHPLCALISLIPSSLKSKPRPALPPTLENLIETRIRLSAIFGSSLV